MLFDFFANRLPLPNKPKRGDRQQAFHAFLGVKDVPVHTPFFTTSGVPPLMAASVCLWAGGVRVNVYCTRCREG